MDAVVIENLTKRLGKRRTLSNLNLEVLENETIAILGLEDAGKTTLAKILFNYIKPSKGKAYIYDLDCKKDSKAIKESVSLVPQEPIFDENLRGANIFRNTLNFHNLKNTEEVDKLCSYFDFNPRLKVADMNKNQKRILSIINALITRPRLILIDQGLDELDGKQKDMLFTYLNELKKLDGLTCMLFTDSLIDAQRYCDRAAYLYKGEIKDIEYLKDKTSNDKILKIFSPFDNIGAFLDIGARLIKNESYEKIFYYDKNMMILSRVIANCEIANYSIEDSSLSDKIKAYFENESQDSSLNFDNQEYSETQTYQVKDQDQTQNQDQVVYDEPSQVTYDNQETQLVYNDQEEQVANDDQVSMADEVIVTEVETSQDLNSEAENLEVNQSYNQDTNILQPLVKEDTSNEINGIKMDTGDYQIQSTDTEENKEDI